MPMISTLEKRLSALEERKIYRIATLADLVILAAMRQRGDPRAPRPEDVVWDPAFADIRDRYTQTTVEEKED